MKPSILLIIFGISICKLSAQTPVKVQKTNPKPVYMHIMPWFDGPKTLGENNWGYHWKMQKMNPNVIVDAGTGKRQIASHYYPQIGPYDSSDPDVIDYQLLLMKLAGVDGILIDWYGTSGNVGDIGSNLRNSDAIVNRTTPAGLNFGLVIEDRFTGGDQNIQKNSMIYAKNNYFNRPNYLRFGSDNAPVVGIFGPEQLQFETAWTNIFSGAGIPKNEIEFLPLAYQGNEAGIHTDGEYVWPYQTNGTNDHLTKVEDFYKFRAPGLKTSMGVIYPGFKDFYAQGENGGLSYFTIPHNGTTTLDQLISLSNQYANDIDIVQIATWNDYGEGTMFEPTLEFGYSFLVKLQQFTGVSYTENDLKQVTRYYLLKKQYANDISIQTTLKQVYQYFASLQIAKAVALMCTIDHGDGCNNVPQISVQANGSPTEGSASGSFTISGNHIVTNTLVNYSISGTCSTNDYIATPTLVGSVQLTTATPSVTFNISAVDDAIFEQDENLIIHLNVSNDYTFTQANDTLTIIDNDPIPCIAPVITYTGTVPLIDQKIENTWLKAPKGSIDKLGFGTSPSDFNGSYWRAMYDNTHLYLLVDVNDQMKMNDSGESWWEDDVVEIFIDGDNSKSSSYDNVNDFQLAFRYNDVVIHKGSGNINTSNITFSQHNKTNGYVVEVQIPWNNMGITPQNRKNIGLEIAVDDDDNGGSRDAQVNAFSNSGNAYQNPSIFGSVPFTTCDEIITNIEDVSFSGCNIRPNPANHTLTFSPQHVFLNATIKIINTLGEEVLSTNLDGGQVDISTLSSGIYTVMICQNEFMVIEKFIKQ
jgi:hypothetical protein